MLSQEGNSKIWRRIRHDCCLQEPISGLPVEDLSIQGSVGVGRVTVTRINVCCSEAGNLGCKSIAMEMFWNRGNKKFLQGDNEPVQDISPASVSGGLRGFG